MITAPSTDVAYPRALAAFPVLDAGLPPAPAPNGGTYARRPRILDARGADGSHDAPRGSSAHRGEDVMAPPGSPVVAPVALRVTKAETTPKGGHVLHGVESDGTEWYFAHMLEPASATVGARLLPGQPFGKVGATGNAAGGPPHLHLRARKGRVYYRLVGALRAAPGAPPTKAPKGAKAGA